MSVLLTLTGGGDADPKQKCKMALLVMVRRKFRYLARIGADSHRAQPTFLCDDDDAAFSAKSDGTKSRLSSRESPLISKQRLSAGWGPQHGPKTDGEKESLSPSCLNLPPKCACSKMCRLSPLDWEPPLSRLHVSKG